MQSSHLSQFKERHRPGAGTGSDLVDHAGQLLQFKYCLPEAYCDLSRMGQYRTEQERIDAMTVQISVS